MKKVPFDLACKLKVKGFDIPTMWIYEEEDNRLVFIPYNETNQNVYQENHVAAPTYEQVVEWFDRKGITVDVTAEDESDESSPGECQMFEYVIRDWKNFFIKESIDLRMTPGVEAQFCTRTEAYDAAFIAALDMRS